MINTLVRIRHSLLTGAQLLRELSVPLLVPGRCRAAAPPPRRPALSRRPVAAHHHHGGPAERLRRDTSQEYTPAAGSTPASHADLPRYYYQTEARRRQLDCRFVGTGQAGILIGGGIALDAVRVDYAAGAVESAVLEAAASLADDGLVLVEGQGSLCHPASTATLPLLRGSQATDLLLVHRANQNCIQRLPQITLPPLQELVACTEALANLARPTGSDRLVRVRAVALNTAGLTPDEARKAVAWVEQDLNLPCTDPIRWGAEPLLEALLNC